MGLLDFLWIFPITTSTGLSWIIQISSQMIGSIYIHRNSNHLSFWEVKPSIRKHIISSQLTGLIYIHISYIYMMQSQTPYKTNDYTHIQIQSLQLDATSIAVGNGNLICSTTAAGCHWPVYGEVPPKRTGDDMHAHFTASPSEFMHAWVL